MKAERSRVSYADLERMPDDGRRFEIVDGELIEMTPSPTPLHQRVSKRLQRQLEAYFEAGGRGEVFFAPLDVILNPYDVFEPDIIVVTDAGPDLGVERHQPRLTIFSAGNAADAEQGIGNLPRSNHGFPIP